MLTYRCTTCDVFFTAESAEDSQEKYEIHSKTKYHITLVNVIEEIHLQTLLTLEHRWTAKKTKKKKTS